MAQPITQDEIRQLIHEWGRLHDDHAPVPAYLPVIAEDDLEIRCGSRVWKGLAGLAEHEDMKQQFFDESHLYNLIELVSASENQAMARSVVTWEASTREASAPRSVRIKAVIHHTWEFTRSVKTGKPAILRQVVDKLDFLPGFAPPGPFPTAPHLTPPHPRKT